MNRDILEGKRRQFKGAIKARWGELTNDDLEVIEGNQEQLAGRVQERYGCAKEEAEKQVKDFLNTYDGKRELEQARARGDRISAV